MSKSLLCSLFFFVSVDLFAQAGGDERKEFLKRSSAEAQEYRSGRQQEYCAFLQRTWNVARGTSCKAAG